MIIVNLQDTELDSRCHVKLYSTTDDFFRVLMPLLEEAQSQNQSMISALEEGGIQNHQNGNINGNSSGDGNNVSSSIGDKNKRKRAVSTKNKQ